MAFLITHPASPNPYATPSKEIADDFRAWGYRVAPFTSYYSFSELTPHNISTRRSLYSIWREEKILHMSGHELSLLRDRVFVSQRLAGVSLTKAGYEEVGSAERYAVAITNVLEGIYESEKIGGRDGVLDVVKAFIDELDARIFVAQAGPVASS